MNIFIQRTPNITNVFKLIFLKAIIHQNNQQILLQAKLLLQNMKRTNQSKYNNYKLKQLMSLNDFVILSKIGEGAYSSVHKVKRLSDGNIYALKKVKMINLKEKEKQNSLNEVRLLASINSDYIIKYKQSFFDSKSSCLCIVIEFADGGDLEKVIEKKKKQLSWIEEKQIWTMMKQTLEGLSILHERNIIHRDLKCANIFISSGLYKIADLNVSKLMKKQLAYTQTGTPYYASPEVWQDKPYELKSDIWSFGCIIYEMCSLKPPFVANNMQGLFKKVMKGIYPQIPSTYTPKLANIIAKCLQIEPSKRPSAKQLLKLIEEPENHKNRSSVINLLSTIKIPKNIQSWKNELPKADYENISDKSTEYDKPHSSNKFGNVSHAKLKQIVRIKREEAQQYARNRLNPEYHLKPLELQKIHEDRVLIKKNQIQNLPRLKVYSQPSDRMAELQSRLKQEQKRKYDHNRPSWWG